MIGRWVKDIFPHFLYLISSLFLASTFQVEYVESSMLVDAFNSLRNNQGVGIAAVDSASASLFLTKAYNEKEFLKLKAKITKIETSHPEIGARWTSADQGYKDALEKLRAHRLTTWVMIISYMYLSLCEGRC